MLSSFQLPAPSKVTAYLNNAVTRRLFPDSLVLSDQTPYTTIASSGLMSLRYYPPLELESIQIGDQTISVAQAQHEVPILLVPPLGVSAWIFDLLEDRSLVKYLLAHGFRVFLVDWGEPDKSHANVSMEDYVLKWMPDAVSAASSYASQLNGNGLDKKQELSILGYCMGGLLSLMYAASSQDPLVRNIATVASPIDFHASGAYGQVMKTLRGPLNSVGRVFRVSMTRVNPMLFHTPGERLSLLFKMTNPLANVTSYIDLLLNMADRNYVATYTTMSRWFNEMLDYPGATAQHLVAKMWLDNQMARGHVDVGVEKVQLSNISANFLGFAGSVDRIVSIEAARRIMDIITSKDKTFKVVPGGHAGVFGGAMAPGNTWQSLVEWLAPRS